MKKKLFRTVSAHRSSQLKLRSNLFKNTCEGVDFKKRCITCNFGSKQPQLFLMDFDYSYLYTFVLEHSFSEHFSVFVYISIYTLSIKRI